MVACQCCGTETDMRRINDREAIEILQNMHTGWGQNPIYLELIAKTEYGGVKKMLKWYLENKDHWWLRKWTGN